LLDHALQMYVEQFDNRGKTLLCAVRTLVAHTSMPNESSRVCKIMDAFAFAYT